MYKSGEKPVSHPACTVTGRGDTREPHVPAGKSESRKEGLHISGHISRFFNVFKKTTTLYRLKIQEAKCVT